MQMASIAGAASQSFILEDALSSLADGATVWPMQASMRVRGFVVLVGHGKSE
jgi:hypothetical protein